MRTQRSLGHLAVLFLSLSPLALAWPNWLPELDALVVRQDHSSTTSPAAQTSSATSATSSGSPSSSGGLQVTSTNLNTGGISSDAPTGTVKGNSTAKPSHTMFNEEDPAGSVVMVTPAATLGTQLYKIGDFVTWSWNYTNLQGPPTAIDVLVSCSTASNTWTLTQNMTFETGAAFTWDTGGYQHTAVASPLLTEQYTLLIFDADSSVSATAEAGYLAPFDGFVFGMYTPQPYTAIADWQCATCSAALSDTDRRALGFALVMSIITVLSFTWFVTGIGGPL